MAGAQLRKIKRTREHAFLSCKGVTLFSFFLCRAGHYLNFDLAFPSIAIPDDFFPSNVTEYVGGISFRYTSGAY
jgi:hypothetical protein